MALEVAPWNALFHTLAPLARPPESYWVLSWNEGSRHPAGDSGQQTALPCGNVPEALRPRKAAPSHGPQDYSFSKELSVSGLVMSSSLRPHGLQPARLLRPWNSPGKNTGVGCHSLLQGIFLTQGSDPGLLHCRQILYRQSYQRNPFQRKTFQFQD